MERADVIGSRQMRAARALLDWSQDDLAVATQLSIATIRKLELGNISPRFTTTSVVRSAFEGAGIEFIAPEGVRRRHEDICVFEGAGASEQFLTDVRRVVQGGGGSVLVTSALFDPDVGTCNGLALRGLEALLKLNGSVEIKCLLTEAPELVLSSPRFEFRYISKFYVDVIPFIVYGDKYAIVTQGNQVSPKIVSVQSSTAAQAFRRQFFSLWEKAATVRSEETNNKGAGKIKR